MRRVLVTGASSGVGASLALRLGGRGASLALVGRSQRNLDGVAADARARGAAMAIPLAVDLSFADGPSSAWRAAVQELGGPPMDVVCCHGVGRHGSADMVTLADYDECFNTNVKSVFALLQAAIPPMRAAGGGHFVAVSSVLGRGCASERLLYCSTKYAVEGMIGAARCDLKGTGVKCSTVCPAAIDTPWWERPLYPDGQVRPKPQAKHLLAAEEVADAIMGLLDQSSESNIATVVLRKGKDVEYFQ